jgi:hypothetical protein
LVGIEFKEVRFLHVSTISMYVIKSSSGVKFLARKLLSSVAAYVVQNISPLDV